MTAANINATVRMRGSRALTVAVFLKKRLPVPIRRAILGAFLCLPFWWMRVDIGRRGEWVRIPIGKWYAESKD
jgi:hypothetical protein